MRSFFDLVGFEYKKIFKGKASVVAIVIVTLLTLATPVLALIGNIYINGELFETKYEALMKDRDYARALSGRSIDETLITEVMEAYLKIPPIGKNESFVGISEYREYGRPYSGVYNILYSIYGTESRLMQNVSQEQIQNFYQIRNSKVSGQINAMDISDSSKDKLIQLDNEIETPFTFEHSEGYERFFTLMYTAGICVAFCIAVCLAPMFAGEYGTRADQLILSSKFGKNKIITAKLFTGISFCAVFCAAMTVLTYFVCMGIYDFDGANAPMQLWYALSIYPITMWQAAAIYSICVLFGSILFCTITILLSSLFKSPFGVIVIISLLLFVPMMLNVPSNILLMNLFKLLPTNMMAVWAILVDYTPYEVFGLTVAPYVFLPIFAVVLSAVFCPFTWGIFKNHQAG